MDWTAAIFTQIAMVFGALWCFTISVCWRLPTLQGKRVLLLIAHPDDEAMFFAPTLCRLTRPELGNQVIILCFSNGDADGLGKIRKEELKKSALQLGITSPEHIVIIEDEKFPDSMTETWDAKAIGNILIRYFAPNASKAPSNAAPTAYIDAIITFDSRGVSGHPNHIALYDGAKAYMSTLMNRHTGWDSPTKLYTLTSTSILRKYIGILDAMLTVSTCIWRPKERDSSPTPLVMMSSPMDVWRAQKAMATAHKSQMRWFRWGWIVFSRYMAINDLDRQKVW